MGILVSLLSIPLLLILGVVFHVIASETAKPASTSRGTFICAAFQWLVCLVAFGLTCNGMLRLLEELGADRDTGLLTLTIPAFCLYVFGVTCWTIGRERGRRESEEATTR
jgi:hypothetical protein